VDEEKIREFLFAFVFNLLVVIISYLALNQIGFLLTN